MRDKHLRTLTWLFISNRCSCCNKKPNFPASGTLSLKRLFPFLFGTLFPLKSPELLLRAHRGARMNPCKPDWRLGIKLTWRLASNSSPLWFISPTIWCLQGCSACGWAAVESVCTLLTMERDAWTTQWKSSLCCRMLFPGSSYFSSPSAALRHSHHQQINPWLWSIFRGLWVFSPGELPNVSALQFGNLQIAPFSRPDGPRTNITVVVKVLHGPDIFAESVRGLDMNAGKRDLMLNPPSGAKMNRIFLSWREKVFPQLATPNLSWPNTSIDLSTCITACGA